MKGYKVFNPDWTCRGFQYEVGETYAYNGEAKICKEGFHFCEKLSNCFNYYAFDINNKVAEIEALGEVVSDGDKFATNKIKIIKELAWSEVLNLVNIGVGNTGLGNSGNHNSGWYNSRSYNSGSHNSGDRNSGCYNSGSYNSGNHNSGNHNLRSYNSGSYNSGDYNSGSYNSGICNSGNCNSGSFNSGNYNSGWNNSGDYNSGNFNSGCFNTTSEKIKMFNKSSNWEIKDWLHSRARIILGTMPRETKDRVQKRQDWWSHLEESEKTEIKSLPNFDAKIFKEITGIEVE